jgi:hypothetical protein
MASITPELDRWRDLHARACRAEDEIVLMTLASISTGADPPDRYMIDSARALRSLACSQFDWAMKEVAALGGVSSLHVAVTPTLASKSLH